MPKDLPARPNVEHLKSQAKDLLEAHRKGDPDAIARVKDALPAARAGEATIAIALHDAQSVIAREYGFASFAALKSHVESLLSRENLRALLIPHLSTPLPREVEDAMLVASADKRSFPLTSPLPLIPVRNAILAVGALAPLNIGRPTSIAAIESARAKGSLVAIFAQKDATHESPDNADLHAVGCAAQIVTWIETPHSGRWIVVRATQWIRLDAIESRTPCLVARVSPFAIEDDDPVEVKRLEEKLREHVRHFAALLADPNQILRMTEKMTPLELADAAIANLPCPVDEKARYAAEPSLVARLERVLALLDRAA
jgi:Lon protease-like protein